MTRRSSAIWGAALLLLAATLLPARVQAQNVVSLALTNSLTVPTGVAIDSTDYNAGWVCFPGGVAYTVTATSGNTARTVSLGIRANAAITGGTVGKLADFEYRTGTPCSATVAGTGWTALTQTNATIASASIKANGPAAGRSFSGNVYFRMLLDWSTDLGGVTLTLPRLIFAVTQP